MAVACAAAVIAGVLNAGAAAGGSSVSNRNVARRDAPQLMARLRLPPGAVRLGGEPVGDHGYLRPIDALQADRARVVAYAWWRVPGGPSAAIAYVRAHPPRGSRLSATGTVGNQRAGTSARLIDDQWPAVPGVLGARELAVTATSLPDGETGMLAEAQSDWIVARPAGEHIPASTRAIQITSGAPPGNPSVSLSVTDPVMVRRIVVLINRLPIAQPVTIACPELTDPRLITMTFARELGGRALAVLNYEDFRPWSAPSQACKTISLTIDGRRQDSLVGGTFLNTIERWLGTDLS